MIKNRIAAILAAAMIVTMGAAFTGCSSGSDPVGIASKAIIRELRTGAEIGDMDKETGQVVLWRNLPDGDYRAQVEEHSGVILGYIEIEIESGSARFKYTE